MKTIRLFSMPLLLLACTAPKVYTTYPDWDSNHDSKLQRSEFVEGYMQTNYFDKWGNGKSSIKYEELYQNTFRTLDRDGDAKVTSDEFNNQIKLFYFGLFNKSFDQWDTDNNAVLDLNEFITNATNSNLSTLWDANSDKRISKKELAGGMFYLCDTDSNGTVDEQEFNAWKSMR